MPKGCLRFIGLILFSLLLAVVVALVVVGGQQTGIFSWMNPNPVYQNRATVVLDSIQQMSVLTTTRYNFSSIVTSEREMPPLLAGLYGERQVLIAVGHITAGIDLTQMRETDVVQDGSTLTIRLPPPSLQDCFLDEGASYVAERDTGVFAQSAPELEGQARQYAVQQFRQGALESGVLDEVQTQAQVAISQFVNLLAIPGVETVRVEVTPPDPSAPLPQTCL